MSQDLQNKQSNQPVIVQYLDRFKDQIAAALPKHLTPDRMARIVTTEVRKVPKLLECNPKSLFGAVIQASQLGLEPGGALGHAYLIPYGKDVNLIIGYRGMIDLARRSGQIKSIEARAVYQGDEFEYSFGLKPDLKHVPASSDKRGAITHVYAVAHLVDGGLQWDVMNKAEVDQIRAGSKAGGSGPWKNYYDEMAKKTIIRRLFKYLPVSIEIQQAVGLDEQAEAGISQRNDTVIEGDFMTMDDIPDEEEPATKTDSVKAKIAKTKDIDDSTGEIIDVPEQKSQPETPSEPASEPTTDDSAPTYAEVAAEINNATSASQLDLVRDLIKEVRQPVHRSELEKMLQDKLDLLAEGGAK